MIKIIKVIIGIILISYSLMFWLFNLNLLIIGYNLFDYLLYLLTHLETLLIIPGILIIYKTLKQKNYWVINLYTKKY